MTTALYNAINAITDKAAQSAVIRQAVGFAYRQMAVASNSTPFEEIGRAKWKGRKALFAQAAICGLRKINEPYKGSTSYKNLTDREYVFYVSQMENALAAYDEALARLEGEAAAEAAAKKVAKAAAKADTTPTDTTPTDTTPTDTTPTLELVELRAQVAHIQALTGLSVSELSGLESPDEFKAYMLARWGAKAPANKKVRATA